MTGGEPGGEPGGGDPGAGTRTGTESARPPSIAPAARLPGPDVVRALALWGVFAMNYHGYLIIRGAPRRTGPVSDLFDPWTGVLSTRFAATFVLVAGVGVTLMTRSAVQHADIERIRALRWRLASRGLVLYAFGLGFDLIWAGTILPFYGAMFAVAAVLFTLRTTWIVVIGAGAAIAGAGVAWWRLERALDGGDASWLTDPGPDSVRGLLFDVAVNGTHPLLPWLAFFCAGIIVGRIITAARRDTGPLELDPHAVIAGAGLMVAAAAHFVRTAAVDATGSTSPRLRVLLSTDPLDRGLLYTASALGTALVAFAAISYLANRFTAAPAVDVLGRAGQMSLTIYVAHALVFNLLVDWLGWIEPRGVGTALATATIVWCASIAAAVAWQHQHGRGPLEHVYRSLTP